MAITALRPAGDLRLEAHKLVFTDGGDFVRQKVSSRFKFFLGEWFMDRRQGIPYFRDVFVQNPNRDLIRSLFRRVLAKTPGVGSVTRFDLALDFPHRRLSFDFAAKLTADAGTLIVKPGDRDFLLDITV